jgi:hypothetical protein
MSFGVRFYFFRVYDEQAFHLAVIRVGTLDTPPLPHRLESRSL